MADVSIDTDITFMNRGSFYSSDSDSCVNRPGSARAETCSRFGEASPLVRHDIGTPVTSKYRMLHVDTCTNSLVSPWHGIKLYSTSQPAPWAEPSDYFLNFVCKTPRGSRRKFEVAQDETLCPLRLQESDGKGPPAASFSEPVAWNVGMLPQTYADITQSTSDAYGGLRNDGRPIECLDIGSRCGIFGEVYSVKPLGLFSVVKDSSATLSWKLVAISVTDEMAEKLHGVKDIAAMLPGVLVKIRSWLTGGIFHGGLSENEIGFSGRPLSPTKTSIIIAECHASWQLLASELPPVPQSLLTPRPSNTSSETAADRFRKQSTQSHGNAAFPKTNKRPPVTSQSYAAKDFPTRSLTDSPTFAPEEHSQQLSPSPLGLCHVREALQRGLLNSTYAGPSGKVVQQPVLSTRHPLDQMSLRSSTNYVFTNARPSLATAERAFSSSTPSHPAYTVLKREDRARKGLGRRSSMEIIEGGELRVPGGLPKGRLSSDSATDVRGRSGGLPSASAGPRLSRRRSVELPTNREEVGRQRRSSISFARDIDEYQFGIDTVACTPDFDDLSVAVVLDSSHPEMRAISDANAAVPVAVLAGESSDLYSHDSFPSQSSSSFRTPLISPKSPCCLKSQSVSEDVAKVPNRQSVSLSTRRTPSFRMERRVSFEEKVEVLTFGPGVEE